MNYKGYCLRYFIHISGWIYNLMSIKIHFCSLNKMITTQIDECLLLFFSFKFSIKIRIQSKTITSFFTLSNVLRSILTSNLLFLHFNHSTFPKLEFLSYISSEMFTETNYICTLLNKVWKKCMIILIIRHYKRIFLITEKYFKNVTYFNW